MLWRNHDPTEQGHIITGCVAHMLTGKATFALELGMIDTTVEIGGASSGVASCR